MLISSMAWPRCRHRNTGRAGDSTSKKPFLRADACCCDDDAEPHAEAIFFISVQLQPAATPTIGDAGYNTGQVHVSRALLTVDFTYTASISGHDYAQDAAAKRDMSFSRVISSAQ